MNEVKLLNIGGIDQNVKDQYARDIIAPSENGLDSTSNLPVASRHYDAGEFLIGQDRLYYEALVEINVGDTLVVNSNIKATTVSDELVSLRNKSADSALEAIAYVEKGVTSTRAYSIGSYLYWNYGLSAGLYKVKAAISPSDALVVDTNIEAVPNIGSQIEIITNQVDDISDEIADMNNGLGAKNLLPNNATSQTIDGVTFTVNSDGTVTATGQTGTDSNARLILKVIATPIPLQGNTRYILSGVPSNTLNLCNIQYGYHYNKEWIYIRNTTSSGVEFTYPSGVDFDIAFISIPPNTTLPSNGLTFKPMIRPASVADDTYVPYAMTNRELTNADANINKKISCVDNQLVLLTTHTINRWGRYTAGLLVGFMNGQGNFIGSLYGTTYKHIAGVDITNLLTITLSNNDVVLYVTNGVYSFSFTLIRGSVIT